MGRGVVVSCSKIMNKNIATSTLFQHAVVIFKQAFLFFYVVNFGFFMKAKMSLKSKNYIFCFPCVRGAKHRLQCS